MIVVDTTVLAYAVGAEHPLRAPCRALVGLVRSGRLRAATTPEVVQEFVHVRARRRPRAEAVQRGRDFGVLLAPLVQVTPGDLDAGLELFERHEALGAFDAVLAAVAQRCQGVLVSADGAFGAVRGLDTLSPATAGFGEALESLAS